MFVDSKKSNFVYAVSSNFSAFVDNHISDICGQRSILEKMFSIVAKDRGGVVSYSTLDGVILHYRLFSLKRADKTIRPFLKPSHLRSNYYYMKADCLKTDFHKMRRGYLANFVQSLDGAILRLVAVECAKKGVYFRHTHDCFSINPADVELLREVIEYVYEEHVFKIVPNSKDVCLWGFRT